MAKEIPENVLANRFTPRSCGLFFTLTHRAGWATTGVRRFTMGDKGKKDKEKSRKRKQIKQEQAVKIAFAKQPAKAP
jgi:hypothetical protein